MSTEGKSSADTRRLEMLESTPASRAQVGAILGEFQRHLGIRRRNERLSISAALLDLDDLGSTWDLTMGQAGKLLHLLRATEDRAELYQRVEAANRERLERRLANHVTVADVLGKVLRFIAGVVNDAAL
jgi:hypothetical protein